MRRKLRQVAGKIFAGVRLFFLAECVQLSHQSRAFFVKAYLEVLKLCCGQRHVNSCGIMSGERNNNRYDTGGALSHS